MKQALFCRSVTVFALLFGGLAVAFSAETFGPFTVDVPAGWTRASTQAEEAANGWMLQRSSVRVVFSRTSVAFKDDAQRVSLLKSVKAITQRDHAAGYEATQVAFGTTNIPRLRYDSGNQTVWDLYPFNAQRIFTIQVVTEGKRQPFPAAVTDLLASVRLEGPAYVAPKRDLLDEIDRVLGKASDDLEDLAAILTGKSPPSSGPPPTAPPTTPPSAPPGIPASTPKQEPKELATALQAIEQHLRTGNVSALEPFITERSYSSLKSRLNGDSKRAKRLADLLATRELAGGDGTYFVYRVRNGNRTAEIRFQLNEEKQWQWEAM